MRAVKLENNCLNYLCVRLGATVGKAGTKEEESRVQNDSVALALIFVNKLVGYRYCIAAQCGINEAYMATALSVFYIINDTYELVRSHCERLSLCH